MDRRLRHPGCRRTRAAPHHGARLEEEQDAAEGGQAHATPFAPRCAKDRIEEALFARRRDLFSELSVVFLDTTSLSFEGAGGETLGQRGHSKDHRPDLMQLILCVVIDAEGRPICTEIMPGNTADVRTLLPVVDRLRGRFAIGRVCIVADRGMISAATIAGLEQRGLEYILGARERTDRLVREVVLADDRAFTPLLVERANGAETQLFAKEVRHAGRRYIVCRNEAEAEKDRADRQAILAGLERQLRRGDKALVGNSAYRRYLRRVAPPTARAAKASPARPSRSTPASWRRKPATTASSCCAPTRVIALPAPSSPAAQPHVSPGTARRRRQQHASRHHEAQAENPSAADPAQAEGEAEQSRAHRQAGRHDRRSVRRRREAVAGEGEEREAESGEDEHRQRALGRDARRAAPQHDRQDGEEGARETQRRHVPGRHRLRDGEARDEVESHPHEQQQHGAGPAEEALAPPRLGGGICQRAPSPPFRCRCSSWRRRNSRPTFTRASPS